MREFLLVALQIIWGAKKCSSKSEKSPSLNNTSYSSSIYLLNILNFQMYIYIFGRERNRKRDKWKWLEKNLPNTLKIEWIFPHKNPSLLSKFGNIQVEDIKCVLIISPHKVNDFNTWVHFVPYSHRHWFAVLMSFGLSQGHEGLLLCFLPRASVLALPLRSASTLG